MNRNRIKDGILEALIYTVEDDNFKLHDVRELKSWTFDDVSWDEMNQAATELKHELEKLAESWTA